MAKIGYVYAGADKGYLDRQLEGLKKYGVDSIVQGVFVTLNIFMKNWMNYLRA